jgi:hypothetical protein
VLALPLVLALALTAQKPAPKLAWWAISTLVAVVLATFARSAWIAGGIEVVVVVVAWRLGVWRPTRIDAMAMVVLVLAVVVLAACRCLGAARPT